VLRIWTDISRDTSLVVKARKKENMWNIVIAIIILKIIENE